MVEIVVKKACTQKEIKDVFKIRTMVFNKERKISKIFERDRKDHDATHFIMYIEGVPVGCARLIIKNNKKGKIERIAILKEHRKKGLGGKMISTIVNFCRNETLNEAYVYCEKNKREYFKKQGFLYRKKVRLFLHGILYEMYKSF